MSVNAKLSDTALTCSANPHDGLKNRATSTARLIAYLSVCVLFGPLCSPPLRWWVLCEVLPSVWVPCLGLCGSPLCGSPLCGSPVWVPCVGPSTRALRHVASTRVMSPARSHAPALYILASCY